MCEIYNIGRCDSHTLEGRELEEVRTDNEYVSGFNDDIRILIQWCDEKGHSDHETLDLIRRVLGAKAPKC